ncbi:MAG: hypothetical protein JXD18_10285 [Anaerolineae bacterium]|nr:hypothetical protein [Anaerolineae bacterium]
MKDFLTRILRLREGELGLVLTLGFLLISNSVAQQIAKIVSVSGFIKQEGSDVSQILVLWLIDMALILLLGALQSLIVDRFERKKLMRWMIVGLGLVYLGLRLMFSFELDGRIIYAIMFVLVDLQWMFYPLIFWILGNDVFDMAQAKRIFPLLASGSFFGKLVGIGFAAAAPSLFARLQIADYEVLSLNVLIYIVSFLVIGIGLRNVRVRKTVVQKDSMRETLTEGWEFVQEVPSFRYLALATAAISVTLTINEFRFLVVSDGAFASQEAYQQFYGIYQLGLVVTSFLIQSFVTSRLIEAIKLKNAFIVHPAATLLGAIWMVVQTAIVGATGCMILAKLTQKTVDESARKAFQSVVPEERRGRVSIFIDSYLPAGATIVGSLITLAILFLLRLWPDRPFGDFYVYMAVSILAGALAVWAALKIRGVYDTSLFNWRLKRRQRGAGVLDGIDF